ncbi:AAA family ATPase [Rhizobium leguminosarum]|uniref:AAA family ATPase n=1 Tax=Rhizobium leguminosarum TaxID=384 RepID=UPI001C97BF48|nr:AAA family ATPase [Rhizobium leguminosarum]MBY5719287.1 AAA family ATPase [Rhizobium leguminosarum]
MRVDSLKIRSFKNLADISIDFDEGELSTVIIGENGTGKSNVIEALAKIFRDLDVGERSGFQYQIAYNCSGYRIEVTNDEKGISYSVDGKTISKTEFMARRNKLLPSHVFAYYSGGSNRLESIFRDHQANYYREVISPKMEFDERYGADLRRLFYCRASYGQLALLSYFAFGADSAKSFLKKHMGIAKFDSALIVLRKPRWAGSKPTAPQLQHGHPRFWYATGLVKRLSEQLWNHALAPIGYTNSEEDDYRSKPVQEEQRYLFIKDEASLRELAESFGDEKTFFALLETLEISDLVREVRIWVHKTDVKGEIPFHEISDGEKQLLSVLGLMRFTGKDESLFLLDEPDTHLNPAWKWNYLQLIKDVVQKNAESHLIMTSHDPLTMASLLASQVQVISRSKDGRLSVARPDVDPRGLGFTSILTQIFGLHTTLDPKTQESLDERNALIRTEPRTKTQDIRLVELSEMLKQLGFVLEDREPEYELFLRAMRDVKSDSALVLSPAEIVQRNAVAKRMLAEILTRKKERQ